MTFVAALISLALAAYPPIPKTSWKIKLGQIAPSPILQKPIEILQVGDAETSNPNVWSYVSTVLNSRLCKGKKFSCVPTVSPDGDKNYDYYAIVDRNLGDDYRYQAALRVFSDGSKRVAYFRLVLPARLETGLTAWDLALIKETFITFAGTPPNISYLNRCYNVRIDDLREACPEQKWVINKQKYVTASEFITLDHLPGWHLQKNPRPDLRNYTIGITKDN